jgi:hypothetical protein
LSDLNDPELDQLERKVSAAFAGTRPRRGFQDEVWARIERRRRFPRLRGWRLAPWPAASALVAVVLIGLVAVLAVPRFMGGHSASSGPLAQTGTGVQQSGPDKSQAGAAARPATAAGAGDASFGLLPTPALTGGGGQPSQASGTTGQGRPLVPYFGPARLTVSAPLPAVPATLPVYRYAQPTSAELDSFAGQLGASRAGVAGTPTAYRSSEFRLDLSPATSGREPTYALSAIAGAPSGSDARKVADQFLGAHNLSPSWPVDVQVTRADGQTVLYRRQFPLSGTAKAGQLDPLGAPAGTSVQVTGGSVSRVEGPLPLPLEGGSYQSRTSHQAAQDVLSVPPGSGDRLPGVPQITLNRVSLGYMAVSDGDHGYYVPVYLFTGTVASGQVTLEKRVVVPALDPSQLR